MYVSIYLKFDNLKTEVKFGTPSVHAVLNEMHLSILVTFKGDIPKNEEHKLGDQQHTLSVYCGRYIRCAIENTQVHLSKKVWSQLLGLASAFMDRELTKYDRLQEELADWRKKYFESKSFFFASRNKCH